VIPGGRCKTCTDYYQCDLEGGCLGEFHRAARRQLDLSPTAELTSSESVNDSEVSPAL
jgi:hypothetical protein